MDKKRQAWHVSNTEIFCGKCKKMYIPDKSCISTKNPNYFYMNCIKCREDNTLYRNKNKNLHYSNYQPSLFN